MTYEQAENEVNFYDFHCSSDNLWYNSLPKEKKIILMRVAAQICSEKLKKAATSLQALLELYDSFESLMLRKGV
ncbi:MAG: hypothetical protein NTX49_01635 [Chlamydiae bacterium]|nr:hypothetical protein [Chlamydiota bacterium]